MGENAVQEILLGNKELYLEYVNKYKDLVYRYGWICLGSEEAAKEVCTDAFVGAHNELYKMSKGEDLKNWIMKKADKAITDKHKQIPAERKKSIFDEEETTIEEAILKLALMDRKIVFLGSSGFKFKEMEYIVGLKEENIRKRYNLSMEKIYSMREETSSEERVFYDL